MHIVIGGIYLPKNNSFPRSTILLKLLQDFGFTYSFQGVGDLFLCLDHCSKSFDKWLNENSKNKRRILVRMETDTIYPLQYSPLVENMYHSVVTLGTFSESIRGCKFGYPYISADHNHKMTELKDVTEVFSFNRENNFYSDDQWVTRDDRPVFIGANKLGFTGSLYPERGLIVRKFLKEGTLDVYGALWKGTTKRLVYALRFYRYAKTSNQKLQTNKLGQWIFKDTKDSGGEIQNKEKLLQKRKYNLIIENSKNFVTEKLFDSIINGAIPLYLGTDFPNQPLLESSIIRINFEQLGSFRIQDLMPKNQSQVDQIRENMFYFLNSTEFKDNWTAEGVFRKLIKHLLEPRNVALN